MTPPALAALIVDHFQPCGQILEPCRGAEAFTNLMPGCDWCEIDEGRDFFDLRGRWDWIVTNPPYSQFTAFLRHAMTLADRIVFLCFSGHWEFKVRLRALHEAGFGLREHFYVPRPPPPWPESGFSECATLIERGWTGPTSRVWHPGFWERAPKRRIPSRRGHHRNPAIWPHSPPPASVWRQLELGSGTLASS